MRKSIAVPFLLLTPALAIAEVANPSGPALREVVAGKTVYLDTPLGTTLPVDYHPDGTLTGKAGALGFMLGASSDKGKWWIKGDRVCQRWSVWFDAETKCVLVRQNGRRIHWEGDDGKSGTGTVMALAAPLPSRSPYALGAPASDDTARSERRQAPAPIVAPVVRMQPEAGAQAAHASAPAIAPAARKAVAKPRDAVQPAPLPRLVSAPRPARETRGPMHLQMIEISKLIAGLGWCDPALPQADGALAWLPAGQASVPSNATALRYPALMAVALQDVEGIGIDANTGTCMEHRPAISEIAHLAAGEELVEHRIATLAAR